jgi:predicted MPP superfamily phosphohydrolase
LPLRTTRRNFLRLAAATGVAALGIDSVALEPNLPQVVQRELSLRRWPAKLDGFRIALLSDFHYDPAFSVHPIHAAIRLVNDLRPDLIVLTGDFVSLPLLSKRDTQAASAAEPCAQLLGQMKAPHGLWAVLGNHDFYTDPDVVGAALHAHSIQLLENASAAIEINGARFWLSGVNDVLSQTADLNATLHDVPADEATILLAHEPDYADYVARFPVDLQLSGHSHGGQVRLPFLPPLYLPDLAQKYVSGLYRIGPLTLYTNRGLGTVGVPVRLNCTPEITLLTLFKLHG